MVEKTASPPQSIQVQVDYLDQLLQLTGQVIINNTRLTQMRKDVESRYETGLPLGKSIVNMVKATAGNSHKIADHLQELVTRIRMVPMQQLFRRFPRVIRDMTRANGKNVDFRIEGETTQVDRSILENLTDPLIHQLRNAVDHGVETPQQRLEAGKPELGVITLKAHALNRTVYITIQDDGRGINADVIRNKVVERGLLSEKAATQMSDKEIIQFIFEPGFSTMDQVTDTSGRGVGMDVVRTTLERLGGRVRLESQLGVGTAVIFELPMMSAVNITDALVVRAAGEFFAIPLSGISGVTDAQQASLHHVTDEKTVMEYRGKLIPVCSLRNVLDCKGEKKESETPQIVIIKEKHHYLGLIVDDLRTPQKVVINLLEDYFGIVRGVGGTTILGGDEVGIILDVADLISWFSGYDEPTAEQKEENQAKQADAGSGSEARDDTPSEAAGEIDDIDAILAEASGLEPGGSDAASDDSELDAVQEAAIAALLAESAKPVEVVDPGGALEDIKELPEWLGTENTQDNVEVLSEDLASEFRREIKEHLEFLNSELVRLEKSSDDSELVNAIFRAFHSIKGAVNMMGYLEVGFLTHAAETLLDDIRKGEEDVTVEVMDLLFDSVKELENCIADIEKNGTTEVRAPDLLLGLAKMRDRRVSRLQERAKDVMVADYPDPAMLGLLEWGFRSKGSVLVEVILELGDHHKDDESVALRALRKMFESGVIMSMYPTAEEIEAARFGDTIKVLFASDVDEITLEDKLKQELEQELSLQAISVYPWKNT